LEGKKQKKLEYFLPKSTGPEEVQGIKPNFFVFSLHSLLGWEEVQGIKPNFFVFSLHSLLGWEEVQEIYEKETGKDRECKSRQHAQRYSLFYLADSRSKLNIHILLDGCRLLRPTLNSQCSLLLAAKMKI